MADKKQGYRLEYALSNRSKCKGGKPCNGTLIGKGDLRLGTIVDISGKTSFAWRHWGCVTEKVIQNIKKLHDEAEELDGYEDLRPEDQKRVVVAFKTGAVDDEDIPESARKNGEDEHGEGADSDDYTAPAAKKKGGRKKVCLFVCYSFLLKLGAESSSRKRRRGGAQTQESCPQEARAKEEEGGGG
ncbi:hypothetical protein C8F01DRAFT_979409 [Mycena amicta]|nr:hypothetical protein C8F01DRAFT_979409 [Mycena amicta]